VLRLPPRARLVTAVSFHGMFLLEFFLKGREETQKKAQTTNNKKHNNY
jgi:hypothetical protein